MENYFSKLKPEIILPKHTKESCCLRFFQLQPKKSLLPFSLSGSLCVCYFSWLLNFSVPTFLLNKLAQWASLSPYLHPSLTHTHPIFVEPHDFFCSYTFFGEDKIYGSYYLFGLYCRFYRYVWSWKIELDL